MVWSSLFLKISRWHNSTMESRELEEPHRAYNQGQRFSQLLTLKGFSDFSAQLVSIIFIYTEIRIATENVRWCGFNSLLFLKAGGAVALWLVRSIPERAVRVRALAGDIVLCSWARHFTLTVLLFTQVYKLVLGNLMLGLTLGWTSIPARGE